MKVEINYNGEKFLIRSVFHNEGGHVNIGGFSLENRIVVNGDYPDREAQAIDEQIYGYVDDEVLEKLTDEEFKRYVNRHLD